MLLFAYTNSTCNSQVDEKSTKSLFFLLDDKKQLNYIDNDASEKNCIYREISIYEKVEQLAFKCCYLKINCKFKDDLDNDGEDEEYNYDVQACTTIDGFTYTHPDFFKWTSKDLCDTYELHCYSSYNEPNYLKLIFISFIIIFL